MYQNVGAQNEVTESAWHVSHDVPQTCTLNRRGNTFVGRVSHKEISRRFTNTVSHIYVYVQQKDMQRKSRYSGHPDHFLFACDTIIYHVHGVC